MTETHLTCRCDAAAMIVEGPPIMAAECHCASCAEAAALIEALPGAGSDRAPTGGTPYVMMRKDRVAFGKGAEHLASLRLRPEAKTRRVIATCCNTPMFLEFSSGHWLSIHAGRWPVDRRPPMQTRTMTKDRTRTDPLPTDLPNPGTHTPAFMLRLLGAWVAMGFRVPKVTVGERRLDGQF